MKDLLIKRIFNLYHFLWALGSALFYRFPSQKMIIIGVTGTTGKSTTVEMIAAILEKAGYKVASSSSIRFKVAGESSEDLTKQTMPGRGYLQKFLRKAINSGCQYAVMEVSSEGIRQHRQRFIDFDVAVITNLAPEHIESHGGFENYKNTKLVFFKQLASSRKKVIREKEIGKFIVANSEIPQVKEFADDKVANLFFDSKINPDLRLKLAGDFWHLNANAALAVARSQGVAADTALEALSAIEYIPGRMEEIKEGQDFKVFVDYAHTPSALEAVYKTLKSEIRNSKSETNSKFKIQNSKLICVLGAAGGGRDKWKRPEFGKLAWQYCDEIILTNEDPYDENPISILEQIEIGFSQNPKHEVRNPYMGEPIGLQPKLEKILDRREAISKALKLAQSGDIVIITGKGCESWMMLENGKKIPWDDRKVAREYLLSKAEIR